MKTILKAGAVAGVLDIAEVFVFFAFRGVMPSRILHYIASGVMGPSAYRGGVGAAALGLALHFFIAFAAAAVYYAVSSKIGLLQRRPIVSGVVYGLGVYLFMNFAVLPLFGFGPPAFHPPVVINGLFAHIFCVGLPIALITARGRAA